MKEEYVAITHSSLPIFRFSIPSSLIYFAQLFYFNIYFYENFFSYKMYFKISKQLFRIRFA